MGCTKRICEKLVLFRAKKLGLDYVAVRFGNVFGSRGSVVPIFENLIAQGKPLTVTHPEVNRFFMSIPEACFLVLQAAQMGKSGHMYVLDMGEPLKIVDVARKILELRGKTEAEHPIVFTGLIKGEKVSEELFYDYESVQPSAHPEILYSTTSLQDEETLFFHSRVALLIRAAQKGEESESLSLLKLLVKELEQDRVYEEPKKSSWPFFEDDEVDAASSVLREGKVNYWTGNEGTTFEKEFKEYVGSNHAVAVSNGTVALELALYGLQIGNGDEVIVPCRTYIATASCVVARGGTPVVADIDQDTGLVTRETVEAVWTPKTRAIIVVHVGGWPCEMDPILEFAKEKNLKVIEDCAQSHGATYKGRQTGSIGDVGCFSFCQEKIMTSGGEGGMVCTNDEKVWKLMWSYKDIGRDYDAVFNSTHPPGFRWLTYTFGTNFRMTEMQAAIGRIQLRKLDSWVNKRRRLGALIEKKMAQIKHVKFPVAPDHIKPAYYKFYCFLDLQALNSGWTRQRICDETQKRGGIVMSGSCCEIYREKCFTEELMPKHGSLPGASLLGENSLMMVCHPTLSAVEVEQNTDIVIQVLKEALKP